MHRISKEAPGAVYSRCLFAYSWSIAGLQKQIDYSTVNSLLRGKSDSPNLKTLIRIATAFNMTIVEFLNVPEIIEFSEDDLEDESEKNEGQEETDKALREVVHRGE